VNGTVTGVYLNMNGTWTDVTGRIQVTRPGPGSGWSINNNVAIEMHVFQEMAVNVTVNDHEGSFDTKYTQTGDGYFNNYWRPHESRLIMLQGTTVVSELWANDKAPEVLKSGKITFKTETFNTADYETEIVNKTIEDTWSYATKIK
jgi:hypothetical protein